MEKAAKGQSVAGDRILLDGETHIEYAAVIECKCREALGQASRPCKEIDYWNGSPASPTHIAVPSAKREEYQVRRDDDFVITVRTAKQSKKMRNWRLLACSLSARLVIKSRRVALR